MQTKNFKRKVKKSQYFKKVKEICIKCKTMEIKKTGEGRKQGLCMRCYSANKKHINVSEKKYAIDKRNEGRSQPVYKPVKKSDPRLNRNSIYWEKSRFIRLKMKFRYQAFQVYGMKCMCCGVGKNELPLELDHILPISIYPEKEFEFNNTQILCANCNSGKSNKDFTDFRSNEQKERMKSHIELMPKNEDISLVNRLQQNIKEYRKLTFMEQVTGVKRFCLATLG